MNAGHMNFIELIPEMYAINKVEILKNKYNLEFGAGADGDDIHDVVHARWASNLQDFMFKMRAALESEHCSLNLHFWIDNIFGINQTGENAKSKMNVYSEECYKENINFNNIKSKIKLQSLKMQIHQYGQLPAQLFDFAHPKKKLKAQVLDAKHQGSDDINTANGNYVVKIATHGNNMNTMENQNLDENDQSSNFDLNLQDTKRYSTDLIDRLNALRKNLEPSQSQHIDGNIDNMYDKDNFESDSDYMFNSQLD
jgi:hypothetical protein